MRGLAMTEARRARCKKAWLLGAAMLLPLAFATPDYNVALWWHTSIHDDPFLIWFRKELHALVETLVDPPFHVP